jgi:hypothetical protein
LEDLLHLDAISRRQAQQAVLGMSAP